MKACSKCGVVKAPEDFPRDSRKTDGLHRYCRACSAAQSAVWRLQNRDRAQGYERAYRSANRGDILAARRDAYAVRAEAEAARRKRWRTENRETHLAGLKKWRESNRSARAALQAKRRTVHQKATPAWANLDAVVAFYVLAEARTKSTGVPHEVDHIEPLQGKHVCGLHNEFNLRVVPASVNRSKGNRPSNIEGFR